MLRDLLITGIVVGLLPFCFLRPWIGVLVVTWLGYMNPHRLSWGFAYNTPFVLFTTIATLAGLFVTRDRGSVPRSSEVALLVVLWVVFLLSTLFAAIYPADAWTQFSKVSKILILTFVTMMLIQTRARLTALLGVVAFSIGFFGLKGGVWALLTGGQNQVLGPPGSFIAGNTEIGLAINMNLPILLFLRSQVRRPWLRHLMFATFLFSIVAVLATYSRGALLGLVAVLGFLVLRSRARVVLILLFVTGILTARVILPEKWFDRMHTIESYQEDASAMGRIRSWTLATRIAASRPILGGGFRAFTQEVTQRYMPGNPDPGFDAHNIFFQVLGEHGYAGLIVYASLILVTMGSLHKVHRRARRSERLKWIAEYSVMTQASLLAFVVSGFFLSLSYFDLFFLLVAVTAILKWALKAELAQETMPTTVAPLAAVPLGHA